MQSDKELKRFYDEINEELKAGLLAEDDGTTPEQLFTEYCLSLLADAGETENFVVSYDEKVNRRGVEHKVNGYSLYENYETLDLFITLLSDTNEIPSIPKGEIDRASERLRKFFKNAIYNNYKNEIEESSEIFDIAHTLAEVPQVKEFLSRVNIFILTNGIVKSEINLTDTISGYSIFYRIIDLNYLFNISSKAHVPIEISFADEGFRLPCILNNTQNDDYQSYLGIIPGDALVEIYERYGARLLEQNVRSFLQFTGKYNRGIRNTIINEPHMFLAFNNGIAATAEEIEVTRNSEGTFIASVKDFQIVNGGQTTASIYHTWKKNKETDISKIFVQLKLTIIKNRENFGEIVGRIAEYANTQNKVSASDLSSNKENHVLFEKISRTIWAAPTKDKLQQTRWFFERARGQYKNARQREGYSLAKKKAFDLKNPRSQVLTKESLAKYINCMGEVYKANKLVIGPHIVVRGAQKNYAQFVNNNYKDRPDNIFFEDTVAKALLFKSSEKIYGVKPNAIGDMRYITVPYTIGLFGYLANYQFDLYRVWKKQEISEPLKTLLRGLMIDVEHFIKSNAPGSLYGEWAKKEECWNLIKESKWEVNLGSIQEDLINKNTPIRLRISDKEVDDKLAQSELKLISSIPSNKWLEISKLGNHIEEVNQHLKDRAINIMSTINQGKSLSVKQRIDALKLIDILVDKIPEYFDSLKEPNLLDDKTSILETRSQYVIIDIPLLQKMVDYDSKAKVLKRGEQQYLADYAYGLKKMNDFHRSNLERHLQTLIKSGYNLG